MVMESENVLNTVSRNMQHNARYHTRGWIEVGDQRVGGKRHLGYLRENSKKSEKEEKFSKST
jgi:hypothetical protein